MQTITSLNNYNDVNNYHLYRNIVVSLDDKYVGVVFKETCDKILVKPDENESHDTFVYFLAKGLEKVSNQDLDTTENIKIKIVSKEEIVLKVQSQELTSGGMIAALFLWILHVYSQ